MTRSARSAELLYNGGGKAPTFPHTNLLNVQRESRNDTSPVRLIWVRRKLILKVLALLGSGRTLCHHRTVSWQLSVMRTPVALPPILKRMEQRMPERRRFTQTTSLEERLAKEAKRLRKQAQGTPPGIERERLVRKARRAETASRMTEWLASGDKHQDKFNRNGYLSPIKELHVWRRKRLAASQRHTSKRCIPSASRIATTP